MNVVAYARFSSDGQREESIDAQLRAIREYCTLNNYNLIDMYVDEAKSATTDQRPAFQRMINDAATGKFKYVIVHKLDRFSRDRYDSAIYKNKLKVNGVRLLSVLERLDDSPESVILESLLEGMAEYYSKNLSREVKKGLNENALKAKFNGGKPPLGYDIDADKNYVINPYEALIIKEIYRLYNSGAPYSYIIDTLDKNGYKSKTGRKFNKTSLLVILKNEKYKGTYNFNDIRLDNAIPAIVSEADWNLAQENIIKSQNFAAKSAKKAKEPYLLSGLIYCSKCGNIFFGEHQYTQRLSRHYYYYRCSGYKKEKCTPISIPRDLIENAIIDWLEKEIFTDEFIVTVSGIIHDKYNKQKAQNLPDHNKQLADLDRQLDNVTNAIANGLISDTLKNKLQTLEEKRNVLLHEISKLERGNPEIEIKDIKNFIANTMNIRHKPRFEQHKIISTIIKKIVITKISNDDYTMVLYPLSGTEYSGTGT